MLESMVLGKVGVKGFKHHQQLIFDCLMKKQDCLSILLTGYGKSLHNQATLPVCCYLLFCGHGHCHFEFLDWLEANIAKYEPMSC